MNKILTSAVAAALLTSSLGSLAQPGPRPDDQRGSPGMQQEPQRPSRDHDMRGSAPQGYAAGPDRSAGPGAPRFQRGERLPSPYRGHQYVVDDWRGHGLQPPSPGHHWVQVGDEYVLVAIATGVITSIILNGR